VKRLLRTGAIVVLGAAVLAGCATAMVSGAGGGAQPEQTSGQRSDDQALTAAVIFGLLNDFAVDEAVRLGARAAALTLQSRETVCPKLSLERLYDQLVI